jgi:DnaK suppressor protein
MATVTSKGIASEKELLAQPADEYMSAAQLDFFRRKLKALESELRANAGETTEHLRETVLVPDPADRATIEEQADQESAAGADAN